MNINETLFDDQKTVKQNLYNQIRTGTSKVIAQGSTGSGKTRMAAAVIEDSLSKGYGSMFICPQITLVEQAYDSFQDLGIDCGIIQANNIHTDYSKKVQVCSIQTIASILKRDYDGWIDYQKNSVIHLDECHLHFDAHETIADHATLPVIGWSATPFNRKLANYFQAVQPGLSTRELINLDRLSDYDAWTIEGIDLTGIPISANGDHDPSMVSARIGNRTIGSAVKNWEVFAKGQKTILFAPLVRDAERFAEEFNRAGYRAVSVSGYMDKEDTRQAIKEFKRGDIDIICSVQMLTLGFDVPDTICMLDYQPTESISRAIQKWGRVLRTAKNKKKAIIIDAVGNMLRLGMPCAKREYSLDKLTAKDKPDRVNKDDLKKPKKCKCGYMVPYGIQLCPKCGHSFKKESTIEVTEGKLTTLAEAMKVSQFTQKQKDELLGMLKGYVEQKKKAPGYAAQLYKQKLGQWPTNYRVPTLEPSKEILSYIRSRNIAYAKRSR